jgi:hypothetical protein
MLDLSIPVLTQVVDQAMTDAADHPRWLNAITKAVTELLSNPLIARQDGHLLVASRSTTAIHTANGSCTCPAFAYGEACWHRAAARLVRRHDEVQAYNQQISQAAERMIVAVGADATRARWATAQQEIDELYA